MQGLFTDVLTINKGCKNKNKTKKNLTSDVFSVLFC